MFISEIFYSVVLLFLMEFLLLSEVLFSDLLSTLCVLFSKTKHCDNWLRFNVCICDSLDVQFCFQFNVVILCKKLSIIWSLKVSKNYSNLQKVPYISILYFISLQLFNVWITEILFLDFFILNFINTLYKLNKIKEINKIKQEG